ncbi:MAG TPA: hypothetical protein VF720_05320 [Candidatus Eisenbacteria bacterium]
MRLRNRALSEGIPTTLLLGLLLASPASAVPQPYTFEGLAAGTIVAGVKPNGQILASDPYPGFEFSVIGNAASNSLCIFDSAHPTGADLDLGTPNDGFGGPGKGNGGKPGMPGQNKTPQGKVLVIPENLVDVNQDGRVDTPDDNHLGGQITVNWTVQGLLLKVVLLDIEESGAFVDCYKGNQLVQSFPVPALGDNSQVEVLTETTTAIDRTVITLPGSGSLAAMTFDNGPVIPVPVEDATWSRIKNLTRN